MKRKILVVGSGGREHALAQKINRSPLVETVYCAKGNPGMLEDGIVLVAIDERNHEGLIDFCLDMSIDWVIVGPEQPLLDGLVDDLKQAGIPAFGPSKEAAKIEGSKDFLPPKKEMRKPAMMAVKSPFSGDTPEAIPKAMAKGSATIPTMIPAMRSA